MIAKTQAEHHAIYGSALNGNDFKYKLELVRRTQPEVVAFGSSRMMQFRSQAFSRPFVNCSGVAPDLDYAERFLDKLYEIDTPKTILMGVDYWWFNSQYAAPSFARSFQINETDLTSDKLTLPLQWLLEGKLGLGEFFHTVFKGPGTNTYTDFANLGVYAIRMSAGWRIDGSYLNTNAGFKTEVSLNALQAEVDEIARGANGRASFGYGKFVDPGKLRQFAELARRIQLHGTRLVLILPPVMPAFFGAITRAGHPEYVRELSRELSRLPLEFHDFTDARSLRADDCEYLDGWHPGEVMDLRILHYILNSTPRSALADFLDAGTIRQTIARYPGKDLVLFEDEKGHYKREEACFRPH